MKTQQKRRLNRRPKYIQSVLRTDVKNLLQSTSFKLFLLILSCEALIKTFPAPEFPGTDLLL